MKNTHFNESAALQLPKEVQLQRIRNVIDQQLSEMQRQTLIDFYYRKLTLTQIAKLRGVNKSTVLRTLRRAEENLRTYLKY